MKKFKEQGTGTVRWANGDTIKQNLLFIKYSIWIFQIHMYMYISQLLSISNIKIYKQYFTLNPRNEVKFPL